MRFEKPDYDYPGPPLSTSRSIRVVLLQPAAHLEDEVRALVEIASLDECSPGGEIMPYQALSYAWGEPPGTHAIFLNDSPQPVHSNLFVALRRLRPRNRVRRLWVDALCINQQDPAERASQVAQMADTFHRASQVLIWVGEDSAACDGGATFAFFAGCVTLYTLYSDKLEKADRGEHSPDLLKAFLSRAWFTRRWIVQELSNSKHATLVCGEGQVPWRAFSRTIAVLLNVRNAADVEQRMSNKGPSIARAPQLIVLRQDRVGRDTLDHLENFSMFECTDASDLVYSLPSVDSLRASPPMVVPDHSLQAPQAYSALATRAVEQCMVLKLLSVHSQSTRCDSPARLDQLPAFLDA
ncbi:hypothetical protein LTR53_005834 [Teratosphaeriaceae sp. CCFEE 6253]|nr:hypothetical protein LTR53_005834 [Teratosphaeriaceae sp. CCFEE 6253]